MNWIFSPFFYVYILSSIISVSLAILSFRRRFVPGAKILSYIMICVSIWSFFGALELAVQDNSWKITFSKIEYLGIVGVSPLWLVFVANLLGLKNKILQFPKNLLFGIIPLMILFLAFTNEFHHLIWSSFSTETTNWGIIQIYNHGIGIYIFMAYSYVFLLVGTIILFKNILSSKKYQKMQILFLMIASIIPWIANIMYFFGLNPFPGVELTPIAFTITGILIAISIFKYQLFELVPLAKNLLFSTIDIGFLIIDKDNLIIEGNPAAKNIFGINFPMGFNIKTVLNLYPKEIFEVIDQKLTKKEILLSNLTSPRWIEITCFQINSTEENPSQTGKLITVQDISSRKEYEKTILESKTDLSVVIENTKDLIAYIDNNQNYLLFNSAYSKMIKNAYNVDIKAGISAIDFLPVEDKGWWSGNNLKALNGEHFVAEHQKQIGENLMYFETSFSPIIVEGKLTGISEFTRDITKHKETEKELELKVKELERLNNLMIGRELQMIELKKELNRKSQ